MTNFLVSCALNERRLSQIDAWHALDGTSVKFLHSQLGKIEVVVIPHGIVVGLSNPSTGRWYMVQRKMNARYLYDTLNTIGGVVMWRFQCPRSTELRVFYDTTTQLLSFEVLQQ